MSDTCVSDASASHTSVGPLPSYEDELDRGALSRHKFEREFTPMDSLIDNALLIFAAIFVLGIAGIGAMIAKQHVSSQTFGLFGARERRLGFVEQASIGGGRKLVLVRRDNVEHLIMTGGPIDVVIETNIPRAASLHPRDLPVHDLPADSMIEHLDERRAETANSSLFSRLRAAVPRDRQPPAAVERQEPPELETAAQEKAN